MSDLGEGFTTPVYDALTERQLWMGVPRGFGILLWFTLTPIAVFKGAWPLLIVALLLHYVGRFLTKQDPYGFEAMKLARKYNRYFDV